MNFLMYQSLIFQLIHHFLISIPIPSTNLFFQLTHQFNRISIPIPSTKVLLMYLMTIPLVLHLTICLFLQACKELCSKRRITNFPSDDRALMNSRFWKLSFMERRQWLAAYINKVDVKKKLANKKTVVGCRPGNTYSP